LAAGLSGRAKAGLPHRVYSQLAGGVPAALFANQFKRSALPNGPKVTTGGSLSPRGDWRMPSDAHGQVWIDELHRNVPEVLDPASDDIPTKEPDVLPAGGKPIVR